MNLLFTMAQAQSERSTSSSSPTPVKLWDTRWTSTFEPEFVNALCKHYTEITLPSMFEWKINSDEGLPFSYYRTGLMSDSEIASLVEKYAIMGDKAMERNDKELPPLSTRRPTKKYTEKTFYKLQRLEEYHFLRTGFPEILTYCVERVKKPVTWTDRDGLFDYDDRYMVKIEHVGYWMKRSTLERCRFFQRMFDHNVLETETNQCTLKTDEFMPFPVSSYNAIMEYLVGMDIDYETTHRWQDVFVAADYLDCDEAKRSVDLEMAKRQILLDLAKLIYTLYQIETSEIQRGEITNTHVLPRTAITCLESIKGNLHFLVKDEGELIRHISRNTMLEILTDHRLTYFCMGDKQALLLKWIRTGDTPEERIDREAFYRYIDPMDPSCPRLDLQAQRHACRLPSVDAKEQPAEEGASAKRNNLRPVVLVAGGTGEGARVRNDGGAVRPVTPSKSVMAYDIPSDSWRFLPDLPVNMLKPLLATNDIDEIYVLDAHAFREENTIKEHCFFSLRFGANEWHWRSYVFTVPLGLGISQIADIYCVEYQIYFIAAGLIYEQVMKEWKEGVEYRKNLIATLESKGIEKQGTVFALKLNLKSGELDFVAFMFHVESARNALLYSCVVDSSICIYSAYAFPIKGTSNSANRRPGDRSNIFATFSCANGKCVYETNSPIPPHFELFLPNVNADGIAAITLGGCCFRDIRLNELCWLMLTSKILPEPLPPLIIPGEDTRRSFMAVMGPDGTLYYFGGCTMEGEMPLDNCLAFYSPSSGGFAGWRKLASLPTPAMHSGTVSTYLVHKSVSHHIDCPHCKLYPKGILEPDTFQVELPQNYEANLFRQYPPDGDY